MLRRYELRLMHIIDTSHGLAYLASAIMKASPGLLLMLDSLHSDITGVATCVHQVCSAIHCQVNVALRFSDLLIHSLQTGSHVVMNTME
jgi:hypothetical protein